MSAQGFAHGAMLADGLHPPVPLCSRPIVPDNFRDRIQEHWTVTERVTLITGASAGIGTELARVFASNGHRLALAARRIDRLRALADELKIQGKPAPILIPCDLEARDAGDKIEAALAAADVELEYLVNNAGFGVFGRCTEPAPPA